MSTKWGQGHAEQKGLIAHRDRFEDLKREWRQRNLVRSAGLVVRIDVPGRFFEREILPSQSGDLAAMRPRPRSGGALTASVNGEYVWPSSVAQ